MMTIIKMILTPGQEIGGPCHENVRKVKVAEKLKTASLTTDENLGSFWSFLN